VSQTRASSFGSRRSASAESRHWLAREGSPLSAKQLCLGRLALQVFRIQPVGVKAQKAQVLAPHRERSAAALTYSRLQYAQRRSHFA